MRALAIGCGHLCVLDSATPNNERQVRASPVRGCSLTSLDRKSRSGAIMYASLRLLIASALLCTAAVLTDRAQASPCEVRIGRPDEMYALGVMFDEGLGVEADVRRALGWYERAARHGHAESMNRLGILFLRGRGVPLSAEASLAWFRLAAAKGALTASNNIALLYFYGLGVHQSYVRAAKLLRGSANKGDADAQNKLGGMYEAGLGVARDPRRAKGLYLKAAAQGYAPAMVNLGRMLARGNGEDTRDIFPNPFAAGVPTGIQPALLTESDIPSPDSASLPAHGTK
jgi:TPR repeat protein